MTSLHSWITGTYSQYLHQIFYLCIVGQFGGMVEINGDESSIRGCFRSKDGCKTTVKNLEASLSHSYTMCGFGCVQTTKDGSSTAFVGGWQLSIPRGNI